MTPTPKIIHGIFSMVSFAAAIASLVVSIKLGGFTFLKENFINGLCVDVWDGFFLSPTTLLALSFLFYLPVHCYSTNAPHVVLFITSLMGFPSFLFLVATFLEVLPVVLPTGIAVGCFGQFGLSELKLAQTSPAAGASNFKPKVKDYAKASTISKPADSTYLKTPESAASKRKRADL